MRSCTHTHPPTPMHTHAQTHMCTHTHLSSFLSLLALRSLYTSSTLTTEQECGEHTNKHEAQKKTVLVTEPKTQSVVQQHSHSLQHREIPSHPLGLYFQAVPTEDTTSRCHHTNTTTHVRVCVPHVPNVHTLTPTGPISPLSPVSPCSPCAYDIQVTACVIACQGHKHTSSTDTYTANHLDLGGGDQRHHMQLSQGSM